MHRLIILCLLLSSGSWAQNSTKNSTTYPTPEYILPCLKADPNLNKCLLGTFNHLRPYLVNGLADLNVPSIDPLVIEKMVIENGHGSFRVRAVFSNITVTGASNYTITRIRADVNKYHIDLGFQVPRMEVRGKYDVNGNVLLFPVRSKGNFWAVFLDVDVATRIHGKEVKNKANERFMMIEHMISDFKLGKSRFRVRDVVNSGNIIGNAINQFLNNNADEIIREMKPAAARAISQHFKAFLNSAFLKVPLKVWLPDA